MDNPQIAIRDDVVAFLQQNRGESFTIQLIASKIKAGMASVRYVLGQLEEQRVVKRHTGERHRKYYVPTDDQLAQANIELKSNWKPLKPRTHHAQRIADIRAERALYGSIG